MNPPVLLIDLVLGHSPIRRATTVTIAARILHQTIPRGVEAVDLATVNTGDGLFEILPAESPAHDFSFYVDIDINENRYSETQYNS